MARPGTKKIVVETERVVARQSAIPLCLVKCTVPPRIPGVHDTTIDINDEDTLEIVCLPFGVLFVHRRFGDWVIPFSNVIVMRPVAGIDWAKEEFASMDADTLRKVAASRQKEE